ncbi:MAG TPA: LamG-like jellyroll fold domain-containing protein [Verrucomicrobiae bacterium]
MKTKFPHLLIITAFALQSSVLAQPVVTNFTTSVYAVVTDPVRLAFAPDGTLYAGRDASGSGGTYGAAVKIHRIAPGGSPVTEFGNSAVSDPDTLIVDAVGAVSGTVGAVLVGGIHNDTMTGKIAKIAPDGTVTTLFGPNAMLYNPTHFLFDSTGRLLVTDNNSGHVLVTAGGEPTVLIMLAGANYMVQDAAGRLAVSSSSDDKLRLYGLDGALLNGNFATLKVGSPLARGPGGAWGTDLYAVAANGDLVQVDLQGNATNRVGSGFSNMQDLQFGPDGALYASDFNGDRVYRFARPTVPNATTTIYARVTDPARLSFAPDGTLFVGRDNSGSGGGYTDAVKIHRIGPGGSPVEEYGNTAITDPDAVAYDADGSASGIPGAVIVAGRQLTGLPGKIVAIRPDQTITTLYGPTSSSFNPNVFAFDLNGRLLFTEDEDGRVSMLVNGVPSLLFNAVGALHLAVDMQGRLVLGQYTSPILRLYDAAGGLLTNAFARVAADSPLARGPGGFWGTGIFCVNTNGDLLSLDLNGAATQWGTGFGAPWDLKFGPDGALYVSEFSSDLIWRIAPPNCLAQPAGLVSWWPGDGNAEDAAGSNNATATGGLGYTNGMVGQAFDLNGSSAFAQVAIPTGLPLGNQPRTLALWLKTPRNLASATESALCQYGSDANGQMFGLITSLNAPGRLYFFGYNRDVAGSTPLAANTWYHAAVSYDGTTVTLYLNGQPDGFRAVDLNTVLNANGLTIGYRPGGAKWLGQLDEVMLFDRALTAGEIAAIYAAGSNGVCPPTARPSLAVARSGEQLMFTWPSQTGTWYQLQSATNLPAAAWTPEGLPLAGTGGVLTTNVSIGPEPQKFFRLRANR